MSGEWHRSKPPNEEFVEVLCKNGNVMIAQAIYGRDGTLPHWESPDGACYAVSAFSLWRPKQD